MIPIIVFLTLVLSIDGRTLSKRSPQLGLTVIDEPETTPREHPPTQEDIEERRQALLKALIPGGGGGEGGGGGANQIQALQQLGRDIVGGAFMNTGEIFAPLRNATARARENFPRIGDFINNAFYSARQYRNQTAGTVRKLTSTTFQTLIQVATTLSARLAEVFSGVFKLARSLLDNFTLATQNLARVTSKGVTRITNGSGRILAHNFARLNRLLKNRMLFQPVKEAQELTGNLVRGLAEDFQTLQPTLTEGLKTKIEVGTRLLPRPATLVNLLGPLRSDPRPAGEYVAYGPPSSNSLSEDLAGEGGYSGKREMSSGEAKKDTPEETTEDEMSLDDIPKEVLELLGSSKSETKTRKGDDDEIRSTTTATTEGEEQTSGESAETIATTNASKLKKRKGKNQVAASIEDLFGITEKSIPS